MYLNKIKQNKNTSAMVFSAMVILIIAVFLLSVPVPVLADPLAYTAGMAFSAYAEAYGMAAGAGYDFINTSASDRTSIFLGEFDEWQAAKHSADSSYTPVSISDWESAHESDVSYEKSYGGPFLNGTSTIGDPAFYTCMKFNSVIANELNDFYNWFLDKLGFVQADGGFTGTSGKFDAPVVVYNSSTVYLPPNTDVGSFSYLCSISNSTYSYSYVTDTVVACVFCYDPSGFSAPCCASLSSVPSSLWAVARDGGNYGGYGITYFESSVNLYVNANAGYRNVSVYDPGLLPVYPSYESALSALQSYFFEGVSSKSVSLLPYSPKLVDEVISIPDVTSQDYVAEPVETVIGIPWDDLYADQDAIELVAPLVAEQAVGGTLELVEEVAAPIPPTDVQIPFLPVNLPSFALGLSGIWHYVREWVGSLRSFMGVLFGIWNGLPYAMIVPVWASAVIVIVLGIYKRFFM